MQLAIRCRNRGRSDRKQITVFHYTVQSCRNTGQINKQLLLLGICSLSAEEIQAKLETVLAIMKDSHIGSYGVIGLIFYFLLLLQMRNSASEFPLYPCLLRRLLVQVLRIPTH